MGKHHEKGLLVSSTVLSTQNSTLSRLTTTSLENLESVFPAKFPGIGTVCECHTTLSGIIQLHGAVVFMTEQPSMICSSMMNLVGGMEVYLF